MSNDSARAFTRGRLLQAVAIPRCVVGRHVRRAHEAARTGRPGGVTERDRGDLCITGDADADADAEAERAEPLGGVTGGPARSAEAEVGPG